MRSPAQIASHSPFLTDDASDAPPADDCLALNASALQTMDDDHCETGPDEARVALAVNEPVRDRAADECEPHADRERDRHAGDGDCGG